MYEPGINVKGWSVSTKKKNENEMPNDKSYGANIENLLLFFLN